MKQHSECLLQCFGLRRVLEARLRRLWFWEEIHHLDHDERPHICNDGWVTLGQIVLDPETLAGDPFTAEHKRIRRSSRTEAELVEAIHEDEARQGRPMTPSEQEAFSRGFFGQEYAGEVRLLAGAGLLDDEDEEWER